MSRASWALCALPLACFACGSRSELRVGTSADASVVGDAHDAVAVVDAGGCTWQGFPAQHVGPGGGATLDTAVSTASSVLIGFEFVVGNDLANGITAVDFNGATLGMFETLRPVRMPWRTAPVSIGAASDGRIAAVTSLGGCDFFALDASGHSIAPAREFNDGFCSDLQPTPSGWNVVAGNADPTSASFLRLSNGGSTIARSGESLDPGEARFDTPRAHFEDGSTLLGATRTMDRSIVVRRIAATGEVLSRNGIARTGRNFADALVANEGIAFDVYLGSDTLVGSEARVRFMRLARDGAPNGMPTEIAGSDVLPSSEFAAVITQDELWIAYVANRVNPDRTSPIMVQRVSLDGVPIGAPFEVARGTNLHLRLAPTRTGAMLAYQVGGPAEIFAAPILCR